MGVSSRGGNGDGGKRGNCDFAGVDNWGGIQGRWQVGVMFLAGCVVVAIALWLDRTIAMWQGKEDAYYGPVRDWRDVWEMLK